MISMSRRWFSSIKFYASAPPRGANPVFELENALATDRAERLLVDEPRIDAVAMEKMAAAQRFDRIVVFKVGQANRAGRLALRIHVFRVKARDFDLLHIVFAVVLLKLLSQRREESEEKPTGPEKKNGLQESKKLKIEYKGKHQNRFPPAGRVI